MSDPRVVNLHAVKARRELEAHSEELCAIMDYKHVAELVPNAYFSVMCCVRDLRYADELAIVICKQEGDRSIPVNSFRITRTQWMALRERCDKMLATTEKIPEEF